jgi:hypothetical protein
MYAMQAFDYRNVIDVQKYKLLLHFKWLETINYKKITKVEMEFYYLIASI